MQCLIFFCTSVWAVIYSECPKKKQKNSRRKISWHIFHLSYLKPSPKYLPSPFTRQNRNYELYFYLLWIYSWSTDNTAASFPHVNSVSHNTDWYEQNTTLHCDKVCSHIWSFMRKSFLKGNCFICEMPEQQTHTLIKSPVTEDMKLSESSNFFVLENMKSVRQMICHKIAVGYVCLRTTT